MATEAVYGVFAGKVRYLDSKVTLESHLSDHPAYVLISVELTRQISNADDIDDWNDKIQAWHRDKQLHAKAGRPTAPNLTMLFNNGYNPRQGQDDDQAVVFVRDIRNGQNVTGIPLINGVWSVNPKDKSAIADPEARIDQIRNGPFKLWLPPCRTGGDWRVWIYYLNEANAQKHNVLGQYDIYWNYNPRVLSYSFVNHSVNSGSPIDPETQADIPPAGAEDPAKIFNFRAWRDKKPFETFPTGPFSNTVEVRGPLTSGEYFH